VTDETESIPLQAMPWSFLKALNICLGGVLSVVMTFYHFSLRSRVVENAEELRLLAFGAAGCVYILAASKITGLLHGDIGGNEMEAGLQIGIGKFSESP
jgi:hypothetical protein